ncbi:MAG TPA: hypothetical protein VFU47_16200 [Armatimonadota bacterium]|nr:hypothetical protein [Armatimonadota bacterium]
MDFTSFLPAAGGLIGGFLGGSQEPELPPELQRVFHFLMQMAKQRRQFARSVPGSDPQEMAALAQAKALAGAGMGQQRESLLAALGPNSGLSGNAADALGRFGSSAGAQFAGMDMQALLQALQARQDAYGQAAGIASGAAGAVSGGYRTAPTPDFGSLFREIGQSYQYQQRLKDLQKTMQAAPPVTTARAAPYTGGLAGMQSSLGRDLDPTLPGPQVPQIHYPTLR